MKETMQEMYQIKLRRLNSTTRSLVILMVKCAGKKRDFTIKPDKARGLGKFQNTLIDQIT